MGEWGKSPQGAETMTIKPEHLDELLVGCTTPADVDRLYSNLLQRLINRRFWLSINFASELSYQILRLNASNQPEWNRRVLRVDLSPHRFLKISQKKACRSFRRLNPQAARRAFILSPSVPSR